MGNSGSLRERRSRSGVSGRRRTCRPVRSRGRQLAPGDGGGLRSQGDHALCLALMVLSAGEDERVLLIENTAIDADTVEVRVARDQFAKLGHEAVRARRDLLHNGDTHRREDLVPLQPGFESLLEPGPVGRDRRSLQHQLGGRAGTVGRLEEEAIEARLAELRGDLPTEAAEQPVGWGVLHPPGE